MVVRLPQVEGKIPADMMASPSPRKLGPHTPGTVKSKRKRGAEDEGRLAVEDRPELVLHKRKINDICLGREGSYSALVEEQLRKEEGSVNEVAPTSYESTVASPSAVGMEPAHPLSAADQYVSSMSPLQQKIDAQLSLEILLKHKELRLIDQELAKCQIALEQLRRCSLIPYPGTSASAAEKINVSNGVGPALAPGAGRRKAEAPAPWGVTDGPYSRHYAKWLIPDQKFDGGFDGQCDVSDIPPPTKKTRNQSGSASSRPLESLSTNNPTGKDKSGPCIIKRKDGTMVKLVCLDCDRGDFSSAQGFINHCRIAHTRSFESHDAAAKACGRPLDGTEQVVFGGPINHSPVTDLVHPFVRAAPMTPTPAIWSNSTFDKSQVGSQSANQVAVKSAFHVGTTKKHSSVRPGLSSAGRGSEANNEPTKTAAWHMSDTSNFVPSPQTPHLSALMKKKGFTGNLSEVIGEVSAPVFRKGNRLNKNGVTDGSGDDDEDDEYDYEDDTDSYAVPESATGVRMPARIGLSPSGFSLGRPGSSKGLEKAGKRSQSEYYSGIKFQSDHDGLPRTRVPKHQEDEGVVILDDPQSIPDLSPRTSSASESLPNAPSLVSDDEDYAANSSDDSGSPCSVDGDDDGDVMDIDVEVEDYDEETATAGCGASEPTCAGPTLNALGGKDGSIRRGVSHPTPGSKGDGMRKRARK